jgi:hypothetical protein
MKYYKIIITNILLSTCANLMAQQNNAIERYSKAEIPYIIKGLINKANIIDVNNFKINKINNQRSIRNKLKQIHLIRSSISNYMNIFYIYQQSHLNSYLLEYENQNSHTLTNDYIGILFQEYHQKLLKLNKLEHELYKVQKKLKPKTPTYKSNKSFSLLRSIKGHLKIQTKWKPLLHKSSRSNCIINAMKQELKIRCKNRQQYFAVADGTILYQKWLPHYGIISLIQHDNGYFSIYGNLSTYYFNKGDHINKGNPIGENNSLSEAYFSIIHNKKPIHMRKWLKSVSF